MAEETLLSDSEMVENLKELLKLVNQLTDNLQKSDISTGIEISTSSNERGITRPVLKLAAVHKHMNLPSILVAKL